MEAALAKLAKLMGDYISTTNLMDLDTAFLRDELCTVNALLVKLESEGELDPLVKDWRNQVRELGYDIEDCIDDFIHRVGRADAQAGFVEKISHYVSALRARLETANQIKELKTRLRDINERRKRYKLECSTSNPSSLSVRTVDPRLPALYREPANLVGVDGPRDELIRWVMDEKEQLKVVPIVGFGGLGKTTLANEVYHTIKGQFACHAFVSVSQRPDMTTLLFSIRLNLGQQESFYTCEVKDLIDDIRKYLQHKRYLVIIDDLWDTSTWDIIRCALPENNLRSRSIVTTRIENIARACCTNQECFYRLKPLNSLDSRRLLFARIGSEHAFPLQIKDVSEEILRKCGGLPLAIIAIASIISSKPTRTREDWVNIRNSLEFESGKNWTRQILNLSYKDLPHHLKACFLYLGMYPEDHIIRRLDLVRQWVAEGIINNSHRQGMEDLANNYFDDLVNRSLIEPEETDYNGDVLSCRVHDMMLNLIISKCREENFSRVVYDFQGIRELHKTKVRRLSLKLNGSKGSTTSDARAISSQSQIRSFALFGTTASIVVCASVLPESKFLRVLVVDIHEIDGRNQHEEATIDLTSISQLFLLRYVKIHARASTVKLPTKIRGLCHLETIEMYCSSINYPSDIFQLPSLLHFNVTSFRRFPNGISDAKYLHTLQYFDLLENSLENIHGLGELMNLQMLKIRCFPRFLLETDTKTLAMNKAMDALRMSIEKLGNRNLKYLSVMRYPEICADTLSSISPPPHQLETLDLLAWWFSKIPKWLAELHNLCSLDLCVREVMEEDVVVLGALPSLIHLQFRIQEVPRDKITICRNTGHFFPILRNFEFKCDRRVSLQLVKFEAGAMPNLRRLQIETTTKLLECDGCMQAGIEHLLSLKEICVSILYGQGTESERIASECALRSIFLLHPSRPIITII